MPTRRTDEELLASLIEVFRTHGYAGTTLAELEAATGLRKSSLYHRFPGGKEEMVAAVIAAVGDRIATDVLAPLSGDEPIRARIEACAERIAAFYGDGREACLLDTLSIGGSGGEAVQSELASAAGAWINAFTAAASEGGAPSADEARRRAIDAVVRIEGALVVSRVSSDPAIFQGVVADLARILLEG